MSERLSRHAGIDRLLHWVMAISTLVLLATALLPILGVEFAWVALHWWTGLVLLAAILVHLLRSLHPRRFLAIWPVPSDFRGAGVVLARALRRTDAPVPGAGKYSLSQKLIHAGFAVVVLTAIATGVLMMVKLDTPWWERNPYWLAENTWGLVHVIHGLAALVLITMIMLHVYFALRPEKRMYLRSMIRGWITRDELERYHDPMKWKTDK